MFQALPDSRKTSNIVESFSPTKYTEIYFWGGRKYNSRIVFNAQYTGNTLRVTLKADYFYTR